jgi:predicted phage terminase large subunit-like protein
MIFLPPRSTKSVIVSKLLPAWYIGWFSNHEIISVSHSDELASDFGRSVRDIVNSEAFSNIFSGVTLRADVKAAGKWQTNDHGQYFAAGIKSRIAGRGAHLAILDDVMSEADSFSAAGREFAKKWYPVGVRTRMMPNGSIIIVNTRYHFDDICGWLLKLEKEMVDTGNVDEDVYIPWDVTSIPAWLDEEASELLGLPVGSSYFPEWKPEHVLKLDEMEIKASEGSHYWEALYMQRPVAEEGGIIKKRWLQRWDYEDPPSCDFIIQTLDTAFSTSTSADYSVIQTWGIFSQKEVDYNGVEVWCANLILLSSVRDKYEYPDLRRVAQEQYDEYRPDVVIIEKKASGQSLLQDMRKAGVPVMEYLPDRDKVARVYASTPTFEAKRVWLPRTKYADALLEELIQFPNAQHDDQVDTTTMAINYLRDSWRIYHPEDAFQEEEENSNEYKKKRRAYWKV